MKLVVAVAVLLTSTVVGLGQPPAITDLSLTNRVLTIGFAGGELQTSPTISGPWTGSGNTNGQYSETIGADTTNKFYRVRGQPLAPLMVSKISPSSLWTWKTGPESITKPRCTTICIRI